MANNSYVIGSEFKEQQFKSRKEYLVAMAILYIKSHTGYIGMDDRIFFDDAQCDGYSLSDDLLREFDLEEIMEL